jgi:hypothetical protein
MDPNKKATNSSIRPVSVSKNTAPTIDITNTMHNVNVKANTATSFAFIPLNMITLFNNEDTKLI